MWTRSRLKEIAKEALRRNYWKIVLVTLLMIIISGGMPAVSASGSANRNRENHSEMSPNAAARALQTAERVTDSVTRNFSQKLDPVVAAAYITVFTIAVLILCIIVTLLDIFLVNPLLVGVYRFMVKSVESRANISEITYALDHHYKNVVITMLMKDLRIFLWSLLFIIPGIYKKYEYYMVEYILSERPDMPYKEVLKHSSRMMDGQKWNAFVLNLSFILWNMLSAISCGIVEIFYVRPYKELTRAALFLTLRYGQPPMEPGKINYYV